MIGSGATLNQHIYQLRRTGYFNYISLNLSRSFAVRNVDGEHEGLPVARS